MRILIAVIDTASGTGSPAERAAIDVFNDRLEADGHWIMAGGLAAPTSSTVIDAREGEPRVTIGPLHDTQEYMSGFWVIEAPDLDTARRLAIDGSRACNRKVELRPFL